MTRKPQDFDRNPLIRHPMHSTCRICPKCLRLKMAKRFRLLSRVCLACEEGKNDADFQT